MLSTSITIEFMHAYTFHIVIYSSYKKMCVLGHKFVNCYMPFSNSRQLWFIRYIPKPYQNNLVYTETEPYINLIPYLSKY